MSVCSGFALVDCRRRAALCGNEVGVHGCARPPGSRTHAAALLPFRLLTVRNVERKQWRRAQAKRRRPCVDAVVGVGEDGC